MGQTFALLNENGVLLMQLVEKHYDALSSDDQDKFDKLKTLQDSVYEAEAGMPLREALSEILECCLNIDGFKRLVFATYKGNDLEFQKRVAYESKLREHPANVVGVVKKKIVSFDSAVTKNNLRHKQHRKFRTHSR